MTGNEYICPNCDYEGRFEFTDKIVVFKCPECEKSFWVGKLKIKEYLTEDAINELVKKKKESWKKEELNGDL